MNIINIILAVALAPAFLGVTNQTKAFFAGRKGPGIFRLYFDIFKLLRKSRAVPQSSTWIFGIAQPAVLASAVAAAIVFPWPSGSAAALPAAAPAALFFYILGIGRIFTVLGALDAGSAFEGMGASREVQFSAFVEPIVFVILGFLSLLTGGISLEATLSGVSSASWLESAVPLVLAALAFFAVFLSENTRVPFDDPETHLELTMIHEAMLLDASGPDLAFALFSAALKFELTGAFLVLMFLPSCESQILRLVLLFAGLLLLSVAVGVVESAMARMRFLKSPLALTGAGLIAALAVFLVLYK